MRDKQRSTALRVMIPSQSITLKRTPGRWGYAFSLTVGGELRASIGIIGPRHFRPPGEVSAASAPAARGDEASPAEQSHAARPGE